MQKNIYNHYSKCFIIVRQSSFASNYYYVFVFDNFYDNYKNKQIEDIQNKNIIIGETTKDMLYYMFGNPTKYKYTYIKNKEYLDNIYYFNFYNRIDRAYIIVNMLKADNADKIRELLDDIYFINVHLEDGIVTSYEKTNYLNLN